MVGRCSWSSGALAVRFRGVVVTSMSDNWIRLIPEDPSFIPDAAKQMRARARFAEIAPDADEIEVKVCDKVEFFDCGGNFERILCPSCHSEIAVAWWQDRMNEDYNEGFILARYATPCCNMLHITLARKKITRSRFAARLWRALGLSTWSMLKRGEWDQPRKDPGRGRSDASVVERSDTAGKRSREQGSTPVGVWSLPAARPLPGSGDNRLAS